MALSIRIDNTTYPILNIWNEALENGRDSKNIHLEMTHAEAEKLFVDNIEMTLIDQHQNDVLVEVEVPRIGVDDEGNEIETTVTEYKSVKQDEIIETDLSDYCLANRIIDYRDGTLSVIMAKINDKDMLNILGSKAANKKVLTTFIERVNNVSTIIPDSSASEYIILFPDWVINKEYKEGDRVLYNGILYKVLTNHTSQESWAPDVAPSLFTKILTDEISNQILPWEQPNSTNPYMTGDKVTHNGSTWISTIDNNVWEPGVYGWEITA